MKVFPNDYDGLIGVRGFPLGIVHSQEVVTVFLLPCHLEIVLVDVVIVNGADHGLPIYQT